MDQLLNWLWDGQGGYGYVVLLLIASVCALALIYLHFQTSLKQLVTDSPYPVIVLDSGHAQILLSNQAAMQLLGIRSLGTGYLYPALFDIRELESFLDSVSSRHFNQQVFDWRLSESESIKVELSGRKSLLRNHRVWIIYAQPYQATHQEQQQELAQLTIARSALDSLSELICTQDRQGNLLTTNRAFDQFWEGRREEACASKASMGEATRKSERKWTTDPQGRSCLLEVNQNSLVSPSGELIGTLSISHDVTEWHKMQQNLRDEMERRKDTEVALAQRDTILQTILDASPDSIGIFNENMVYQACNKPFVNALGISDVSDLIGKRLQDVIPEEMYARLAASDLDALRQSEPVRYIDKVVSSDGKSTWFDVVKSPFKDKASGTNGVLIMARDISERYLAEQKLERANLELEKLSFMDSLTQVSNRRRFDEQLQVLWYHHAREKLPLTIMLCDIDFFKDYNDCYGHQQGDEALVSVATVFTKVINRSSDCVARYGGEEFGFILPNTTTEGASNVAQRIHEQIRQLDMEHDSSEASERLTVSIGLVSYIPQHGDEPEMGIAMADSALYQAKADGRNRTCIHPSSC
ncbi:MULTISPECIES: sensor domain-containing diguanylate cyclase [Vibrio diabolicus subgroup]|uniref:sensor domain-containing diguanylate cyclase n=1 Tax=Vibrio diabolicus subgroup TaxID=2315253 RepID=UPI00211B3082|nr:diguanylate cyclase [Vibrio antiquarius]MCG6283987.1 diguanylate cyclase [Vibrio diabolicus]MCR9628341.1 diguanylate cyclase [Vibrio antiquarius]MCR9634140.1 diguanylate cyclase [Vibrio antiquarius]